MTAVAFGATAIAGLATGFFGGLCLCAYWASNSP